MDGVRGPFPADCLETSAGHEVELTIIVIITVEIIVWMVCKENYAKAEFEKKKKDTHSGKLEA